MENKCWPWSYQKSLGSRTGPVSSLPLPEHVHFPSVLAGPALRSDGGHGRSAMLQIFQGLCLKAGHVTRFQGFILPETSLQLLLCQPSASSVNLGTGNYLMHLCFPKSHLMLIEIVQLWDYLEHQNKIICSWLGYLSTKPYFQFSAVQCQL